MVDVDDTVVEVHGHAKQGAGFGYNRIRGLNALLATLTTSSSAPVTVAQRLRNAHRIHYDPDYARDVEGYPGLVVHRAFLMSQRGYLTRGPHAYACKQAIKEGPVRAESIHCQTTNRTGNTALPIHGFDI